MAFNRRNVPIDECACPLLETPCPREATGEDRLCDDCRVEHHPDTANEWETVDEYSGY